MKINQKDNIEERKIRILDKIMRMKPYGRDIELARVLDITPQMISKIMGGSRDISFRSLILQSRI
jgi:predicted transcriptional regulator